MRRRCLLRVGVQMYCWLSHRIRHVTTDELVIVIVNPPIQPRLDDRSRRVRVHVQHASDDLVPSDLDLVERVSRGPITNFFGAQGLKLMRG